MSLGERLREMLDPGATSAGSPPPGGQHPGGPSRRRPTRTQAQQVHPTRSYDTGEPPRGMPRAQWIGLGLAATLAVLLTAGLVFAILTITRPSAQLATATPTAAPAAVVSPTIPASINDIFNKPSASTPAAAAAAPPSPVQAAQGVGQRLQIANTGGDGANLRRDPGQAGEKIKTIPDGSLVEIVGADRNVDGTLWRNVRDLQGDSGWVAGGFLATEGSAPIVSAPVPGSASSSGAVIVTSTPGAAGTPVARPTSPGVAASGASRGQVGNTSGQGANIRSEPGSGGKVLKTLPEGANLEVVGPDREVDGQVWRQVRDSSGVTGWIIRGAVAPAGSVATPGPAAGATRAPAVPATGPTSAPAAKPTTAPAAPGATTAPAAPKPTSPPAATAVPGNLPIIIQPATPRPGSGAAPAPTSAAPKPTAQGSIPVGTAKPTTP